MVGGEIGYWVNVEENQIRFDVVVCGGRKIGKCDGGDALFGSDAVGWVFRKCFGG